MLVHLFFSVEPEWPQKMWCPQLLVAGHPDVAAVNQRHSLGHGEPDAGARRAIGVGGRAIIPVEDALAVCHGNYRTVTVHGKNHFRWPGSTRMVMVVPKIEYLHALSMYCVSSIIINCRSQQDQFLILQDRPRPSCWPAGLSGWSHLFNQRADVDLGGVEWRLSPASRRAVVSRRVVRSLSRLVCSLIRATSSDCPSGQLAHLAQPGAGGANGGQRRFVGVRQAIKNRGAQAARCGARSQCGSRWRSPIAVEGDGDQRGDGIVGQRAGVAAHTGCRRARCPGAPLGGPCRSPGRRRWFRNSRHSAPFLRIDALQKPA
jgi:hypothetical protein